MSLKLKKSSVAYTTHNEVLWRGELDLECVHSSASFDSNLFLHFTLLSSATLESWDQSVRHFEAVDSHGSLEEKRERPCSSHFAHTWQPCHDYWNLATASRGRRRRQMQMWWLPEPISPSQLFDADFKTIWVSQGCHFCQELKYQLPKTQGLGSPFSAGWTLD